MNNKIDLDDLLESILIGKLVNTMIDEGYRIELSDQDGGGLHLYGYANAAKPKPRADCWVKLVPGNGAEIIADYSTNLESVIAPVNEFAQMFSS